MCIHNRALCFTTAMVFFSMMVLPNDGSFLCLGNMEFIEWYEIMACLEYEVSYGIRSKVRGEYEVSQV